MGFPSKLFLLEDKQFQLTEPSLMGQICIPLMMSMILPWIYCQHVHACLVLGHPALDTALSCAGQNGKTTSLHLLAAHSHPAQDLLADSAAEACCWLMFNLLSVCLWVLLCSLPQPELGFEVAPPLVQGSAFCVAELHEIPISTFLQPVKVPLKGRGVTSYLV